MESTRNAEPLFQTPDQRSTGTVTYRVYMDGAWRNIEGQADWKNLPQKELIQKIEEVYYTPK
ncbi:MAG: hypothetical protein H0X41_10240 [Chitinophagaceae bacterium]|nr:hypothetical protein [Chitinophagaceae bacterium]